MIHHSGKSIDGSGKFLKIARGFVRPNGRRLVGEAGAKPTRNTNKGVGGWGLP
jgi:hypothetical protein